MVHFFLPTEQLGRSSKLQSNVFRLAWQVTFFIIRYIFLDDDQKISKLLIRKLFFNSDHFMDSILASMSILVKILLYRSQPTNSPIIPGLREINFLQHTMAAIMTAFLKWFPFTTERKFFSAPIIRLKGWWEKFPSYW